MSDQINNLVPLIRKHFDFLVTELGFQCTRTWNDYMSRYQGAEYESEHATVLVEQADRPMLEVRLADRRAGSRFSVSLEEIVREADPEAWARRPLGYAWPRPIEQDEEQMRFLAECLRRYGGAWLNTDAAGMSGAPMT
jgi:hypothetical protein